MKCLIVSGGVEPKAELINKYSKECNLIIGVDRGCNYLYNAEVQPHIILGDFDSSNIDVINEFIDKGAVKFEYDCNKDSTDSDIAFDLAIEKDVDEIFFLGATGGRFDHALGNLGLLFKALNNNVKAYIIDEKNKITMINNSCTILKDESYKYVSFLAYNEIVEGFTIRNAKYELFDYDLEVGDSRTVSNEFKNSEINLQFLNGTIVVIYSRD